jgi:hypothetical protein
MGFSGSAEAAGAPFGTTASIISVEFLAPLHPERISIMLKIIASRREIFFI